MMYYAAKYDPTVAYHAHTSACACMIGVVQHQRLPIAGPQWLPESGVTCRSTRMTPLLTIPLCHEVLTAAVTAGDAVGARPASWPGRATLGGFPRGFHPRGFATGFCPPGWLVGGHQR